jgi:hypothetical protein
VVPGGQGTADIALTFLKPDPAITWDDQRLADIGQALSSYVPPNSNP